jgi:hypothetical protein
VEIGLSRLLVGLTIFILRATKKQKALSRAPDFSGLRLRAASDS